MLAFSSNHRTYTRTSNEKWEINKPILVFFLVLLMALLLLPQRSFSQTPSPNGPVNQPPGSQINNSQYYGVPAYSTSSADQEMTAKVRAEIAGNRNLSQKAQNISISSNNGQVLLQGSVINEYERTTVIQLAERVAGTQRVFSQLIVQP